MFADKMRHEAIPERVYALCELLKSKPLTETEAKDYFEPKTLQDSGTSYFPRVRDAACQSQLGLIDVTDKKLTLAIDKKHISSIEAMRKYIIGHISVIKGGLFFETTQAYFDLNEQVYEYASVTDQGLRDALMKSISRSIDVDDMRAWRFWAAYLGFGHLARVTATNQTQMNFLPNLYRYLQTAIELSGLEKKKEYRIDDFFDAIRPMCEIAMKDAINTKKLNMAMSYGLRMLHDNGEIELRYQLDNQNLWFLYPSDLHAIRSEISHVTIRR